MIDNEYVDKVVSLFAVGGTDSEKGRYARVPAETLKLLGGADIWRKRARERLDKLPETETALLAMYRSIISPGHKYYLVDGSEADDH